MGSPEIFGSHESQKDRLIQSGIAQIAFDSLYGEMGDFLEDMDMTIEDLDFRVSYYSDKKDPQIIIEIPNFDPETKDRVPTIKSFVSDATIPGFIEGLSDEQEQVLIELCEEAGVVVEEPDDLIKERVAIIKAYENLDETNVSEEEKKKIVDAYENQEKRDAELRLKYGSKK